MKKILMKAMVLKMAAQKKLVESRGSFFTENALLIVITVAIGGLLLSALFAMYKDQLIPQLGAKITEFFNFRG